MKELAGNELYRSLDDTKPVGKFEVSKEQEKFLPDFYQRLAEEVIIQACKDYEKDLIALKNGVSTPKVKKDIAETEAFFKSEFFEVYACMQSRDYAGCNNVSLDGYEVGNSNITYNGEFIMRTIRKRVGI